MSAGPRTNIDCRLTAERTLAAKCWTRLLLGETR
jgi:hypothetical protein